MMKTQETTERQTNTGIVNSLNDYVAKNPTSKLTVQTLNRRESDGDAGDRRAHCCKHTFLPIGKIQAKDATAMMFSRPMEFTQSTKQFAAIGGSADEKIPLPQVMADDVKKYAKYDPD